MVRVDLSTHDKLLEPIANVLDGIPTDDRIILAPREQEDRTESGIILGLHEIQSQLIREVYSNIGEVVAVNKRNKHSLNVGDLVHYDRFNSHVFIHPDTNKKYVIVHESDINMIING